MGNIGMFFQEGNSMRPYIFILLVVIIAIAIVVVFGRSLSAGLRDDQRKIVGIGGLVAGIILTIYGISNINSASSQAMRAIGKADIGGIAAVGFGILITAVGFVMVASKAAKKETDIPASTKKCPFCAETIQAEAKICRFCSNSLDAAV